VPQLPRVLDSICLILSLVTPNSLPTSSKVLGGHPEAQISTGLLFFPYRLMYLKLPGVVPAAL